ncbi:MAG: hypothetical protein AAFQ61_03030 [Cyanobacteria bacterium J06626_23]
MAQLDKNSRTQQTSKKRESNINKSPELNTKAKAKVVGAEKQAESKRALKPRRSTDRRQQERRQKDRRKADRRQSSVEERLRIGLWKSYAWQHEIGQDAPLPRSAYNAKRLIDDLIEEAERYQFLNKRTDEEVSLDIVLEEAVDEVLTHLDRREKKAVYVIEEIAATISCQYRLISLDRRQRERRSAERRQQERRGIGE